MQAMDGNRNVGNGWQPECGQWLATGMRANIGNWNAGNGWPPE